jgi:hypothetical protein
LQINSKQQRLSQEFGSGTRSLGHSQTLISLDPLLPTGVTLAEVLGLVEVLGEKGLDIPISVGGRSRFFRGLSEFLSLLGTARMLGLVAKRDNRLFLTDVGLGFLRADFPQQMGVLRAMLSRIEPFKSTLQLLAYGKSVSATEISKKLSEKYMMCEFKPIRIHLVLIEWGLPNRAARILERLRISAGIKIRNGREFELFAGI